MIGSTHTGGIGIPAGKCTLLSGGDRAGERGDLLIQLKGILVLCFKGPLQNENCNGPLNS